MENIKIDPALLDEIPHFATFLHRIGYKRIEGAVYGLLVMTEEPLRSEEIEQILGLSQSAVSQAVKKLSHYGAIETTYDPNEKRLKLHTAKEDSLAIVSTVFRKREQEAIEEFKRMAERIRKKNPVGQPRTERRLNSIIATCEIAESVMNFVIKMVGTGVHLDYPQIVNRLPKALDMVIATSEPLGHIAGGIKAGLTNKFKEGLNKFTGEHHA